ncbi:MAG: MucR family transcriptional regulator [Oceanicaulis sp.]|uniref:MucR family transcriptional regulator n=1 Tax=Glycocaulis sp. TaxID=1969725 RepID=UPI0025BE102E|nr:MucR family transcriptional regulator [Glycocaulis sp.]MCC5980712.1 MucR family transcriptional regulator [Oceanicaulis sp.]MCH8521101.1 MucR family transcriptional regulator [Glycocaulis sp.]
MSDENTPQIDQEEVLRMTTDIVASFVSNNSVSADSMPDMIRSVHTTLRELSGGEAKPEAKAKPAVPISKSVTDDYIICLEDGKKLKMLKRYLRSQYDMSPEDYRRKWGLPSDYPMVAPAYSRRRSDFAKEIGLGRGGRKARK